MPRTKYTTETFIKKSKSIHGDKFNYTKTIYTGILNAIIIICNKCNSEFNTTASNHIRSYCGGCKKCRYASLQQNQPMEHEIFLSKVSNNIKSKYEYLSKYKGMNKKITLKCKRCLTEFQVLPVNHIKKHGGCPSCHYKHLPQNNPMDVDLFEKRCKIKHQDKYEYKKDFKGVHKKINIFCKKHNKWFFQKAGAHLFNGQGCPNCCESNGEAKIKTFLDKMNINYESEKTFEKCKNKHSLFFDFYLPKHNACIEFDGKQHFYPIKYFGGEKQLAYLQKCDLIKNKYCSDNNIKLLRIPFYELDNIENLVTKFLQEVKCLQY